MGKGTDKMYITHSEWSGEFGQHSAAGSGARQKATASNFARLPFDCCALSLKPFDIPMCTSDGTIYDLVNIIPYLRKHGSDPVTGQKLSAGDLIKLNFAKNSEGEYHDPLTFKIFTIHSHLVAVKTTGNVYAYETVERLNIKAGNWRDLVNDEPFTRKDIITLQDPHNVEQRDLSRFHHLQNHLKADEEGKGAILINRRRALKIFTVEDVKGINTGAVGNSTADMLLSITAKGKEKEQTKKANPEPAPAKVTTSLPPASINGSKTLEPYNAAAYSTGKAAASLTSTYLNVATKNDRALIDEEEYMYDLIKEKGYVRIMTNFGNLNVELYCDRAPRTCYNFITLSRQSKYDNTIFHRLIPGFMIQGGDPTGTGKGGESMWGKNFQDEYNLRNAYKHDVRGLMSMANRGPNTNGSQFFFTFRETTHLNGKHTVFGKIVGGMDVLDRMEKVDVNPATDKPVKPIKIVEIQIFKDPYEEYKKKLDKRLAREREAHDVNSAKNIAKEEREKDRTTWFGTSLGEKVSKAPQSKIEKEAAAVALKATPSGGVGRYLQTANSEAKRPAPALEAAEDNGPAKKRKAGGGFGNFSSW